MAFGLVWLILAVLGLIIKGLLWCFWLGILLFLVTVGACVLGWVAQRAVEREEPPAGR